MSTKSNRNVKCKWNSVTEQNRSRVKQYKTICYFLMKRKKLLLQPNAKYKYNREDTDMDVESIYKRQT